MNVIIQRQENRCTYELKINDELFFLIEMRDDLLLKQFWKRESNGFTPPTTKK